jgi:hypothetical protein
MNIKKIFIIVWRAQKVPNTICHVAISTLVSEWLLLNTNSAILQLYQVHFQWDDDEICFSLDQNAYLDFYSAWLTETTVCWYTFHPIGHSILILIQPVFALSPKSCVSSEEATNTNFIVFGLTRPGPKPTNYCTRDEHFYFKLSWSEKLFKRELNNNWMCISITKW